MNWQNLLIAVANSVLEIQARHAETNPGAAPLTNAEVHAQVLAALADGHSNINAFFVEHNLPLPV